MIGDGRLSLVAAAPGRFSLILLDAFSSDAIPVHLLTREALDLYLAKLAEGGLLAFQVSNRYVDLIPVLAAQAEDAGLVTRAYDAENFPDRAGEGAQPRQPSSWVALARTDADLGAIAEDTGWYQPDPRGVRVWTDDYASLLGVLK